jgi:hypothetical protein
MLPRRISSEVC